MRRLAGTRKVGHAGTLDPMATGVLVLGVDRATRLLGHLMLTEKQYDATISLGAATTTDDAEGEVTSTADPARVAALTEAQVREVLAGFVGDIEQVPTAVSAIKVDGKRAYARVRDGEQVELEARPVTVHELVVHAVELPEVRVSVRCSSGTYIRAIARDAGPRSVSVATSAPCAAPPSAPSTSLRPAPSTRWPTTSPSCRSRRRLARRSPRSTSTTYRPTTCASDAPSTCRWRPSPPCSTRPGSSSRSTSRATSALARSPSSSEPGRTRSRPGAAARRLRAEV